MKRRAFIKSLAGLFAATQAPSILATTDAELTSLIILPKNNSFDQLIGGDNPFISKPSTEHEWVKDNITLTSYPPSSIFKAKGKS
jgi:hypothetical protein